MLYNQFTVTFYCFLFSCSNSFLCRSTTVALIYLLIFQHFFVNNNNCTCIRISNGILYMQWIIAQLSTWPPPFPTPPPLPPITLILVHSFNAPHRSFWLFKSNQFENEYFIVYSIRKSYSFLTISTNGQSIFIEREYFRPFLMNIHFIYVLKEIFLCVCQ